MAEHVKRTQSLPLLSEYFDPLSLLPESKPVPHEKNEIDATVISLEKDMVADDEFGFDFDESIFDDKKKSKLVLQEENEFDILLEKDMVADDEFGFDFEESLFDDKKKSMDENKSMDMTETIFNFDESLFDKKHFKKINNKMKSMDKNKKSIHEIIAPNYFPLEKEKHFSFDDQLPINTGPVLEVIYVAISKTDNDPSSKPVEIYGEVTVNDYKGDKFYIFKRKLAEPQLVEFCDGWTNLTLTPCPMAPVMGGKVNVRLCDKDGYDRFFKDDCPIFNRAYDINEATETHNEGTLTLECDGGLGYRFKMVFTKIPFAVIAKVAMSLCAPPSTGDELLGVHGKITANKVVCFQIDSKEKAEEKKYGKRTAFGLLRYVVAASIHSPLIVDVELYNNRLKISKTRHEIVSRPFTSPVPSDHTFPCEAKGYGLRIYVEWSCIGDYFSTDPQLNASPYKSASGLGIGPVTSADALLEVFSVSFGGVGPSARYHPDLYGTIVVFDGHHPRMEFNIFDSDKDGPDKLQSSPQNEKQQFRTLLLALPENRWLLGQNFRMHLKLKDGEDNLIIGGKLSLCGWFDGRYDCRLCYVIKGNNGYFAAVHYSIFKESKKAKVSVECSSGPCVIYGTVFAEYDNYAYPSTYDQQCYRSVIFNRSKENPLLFEGCSDEVPLLKSHVSAPLTCKELIVPVDLWLRSCDDSSSYQRVEFKASSTEVKRFNIGWGVLTVTVNWIA